MHLLFMANDNSLLLTVLIIKFPVKSILTEKKKTKVIPVLVKILSDVEKVGVERSRLVNTH